MIDSLSTYAELQAEKAEALPAFSGIKLLHIKRQLAELLALIGHDGIFDEYTRHDISHIDEMLKILDWLIPETTKMIMSPADWLLTTLAIYFHDMGLLVTKEEFKNRYASGFPEFRDTRLFAEKEGEDYRAKVEELSSDQAERFLYQEFVRHRHAERIRAWIVGKAPEHLGITHKVMSEVDTLLKPLDPQFRSDLAFICESHHLDDLYDLKKYKISQPYGNSDTETANLQYVAVLLRSADLLQITRDRTPSTTFRVINSADPVSQQEWAKQMAVKRVRAQLGRDRDGNFDEKAPRDTIEVHAYFTQEDGFFGLTSYLVYARTQILKCHEWVETVLKKKIARYEFPWRHIDDNNIQTEGFLKQAFEFTIDEAKVLDLLTGHTLYNDTSVVLRELVQNSLDAIRLQELVDEQHGTTPNPGKIRIHWDSKQRILSVEDNGTGMTQEIINKHLLKVGSSRYQDTQFRKQYPGFSSISRFGIGVLSTFMIADTVEITTCHPEDEEARQLSLRSVHGKYLIRLLDKYTNPVVKQLAPHGTLVKLSVRPSAEIINIIETARRWIVVPGCDVSVSIDNDLPHRVGFASPKQAVDDILLYLGLSNDLNVRVVEDELGGITLAYVVIWSEYLREWSFLDISSSPVVIGDRFRFLGEVNLKTIMLGTCIEGVRIEPNTPGFDGRSIVAIANLKGPNAPRTNVARSGLEVTRELDIALETIYQIYLKHLVNEMMEMCEKRLLSPTWASFEARYLLTPLIENQATSPNLLKKQVNTLPILLIEHNGDRAVISPVDLHKEPWFWTIDGPFFRSAELILREISGSASLSALVNIFHAGEHQIPDEAIFCQFNLYGYIESIAFASKEVHTIKIYREQRRVDFRWGDQANPARWYEIPQFINDEVYKHAQVVFSRIAARFSVRDFNPFKVKLGRHGVELLGVLDEVAVRAFDATFLLPNTTLAQFLLSWLNQIEKPESDDAITNIILALGITDILLDSAFSVEQKNEIVNGAIRLAPDGLINIAQLDSIVRTTDLKVFEPSAWTRFRDF